MRQLKMMEVIVRRPLENITVNSYHVVYRDNEEIVEIPKDV